MPVRRRLLFGAACLLPALLLAGVWLLPGMLDWNRYRDGIAALASQQLGRPVRIGGGVSLQLLPQPVLTADDVSVEAGVIDEHAPSAADDEAGLHARALRLRVALGPLLAGKVDARELTLQGADLRLPWPLPAGSLTQRLPSWLTGLQARIEDGRLQLGAMVFTGIDGTIATDPDTGTLSAAGVAHAGDRSWQFTARLARPGGDGSAGLDVSLDGQDRLRDTGGSFSGQIGSDGALSGRIAGRGPDLSLLMPGPALPWRADGRFSAAAGLAVADELALEIGGAPARGAVALRVLPQAQLDVAIAAGRLDLDAWLPALLARNSGPVRAGIAMGIDLSAEAATLAGGTVRRLRGGVDLAQGVVRLRDVTAVLPGDAQLALSGQVATEPRPRFEGLVRLAAPDLRATLRWLQRFLPPAAANLPPGVLRTAELTAGVTADAGQATVADVQGLLDGARLNASVSVKLGARPALNAAVTLDRLALDPWLPDTAALLLPETLPAASALLRSVDAELKLQIGRASWAGQPLGAVGVDLQSDLARVALRRLEAQPLGARLSLSGVLSDAGRLSDGRLDVAASDLAAVRPLLAQAWPGLPGLDALLRGPGALLVLAAGPADALAGRLTLELGDIRLEVQPTVNLPARRWGGPVTLHHPGAPRLLEMLGLGGTVAWLGDGSLSLVGQLAVAPGRIELEGATLAAGALRTSGRVVAEGRRLFGQLSFETLPLPLVYPRSPDPLPIAGLRGWQAGLQVRAAQVLVGLTPVLRAVSTDMTLQDGVLRLSRATGQMEGGTLTGGATLDTGAEPPRVSVQVQAAGLSVSGPVFDQPLDLVAGQVEGTADLVAAGYSPAALLATLHGQMTLRVRDGMVAGFDLAAAGAALALADPREAMAAARSALLGGNTPLATLDVPLTVERGVVAADMRLLAQAGEAHLAGSLDLQGGTIDLSLSLLPAIAGAPPLNQRLTGSPAAPSRTPELAGLARWLADRP